MPVEWRNVGFPLVGGVDTKNDAKTLNPPKLSKAQNIVFIKGGGVECRPGYRKLSNSYYDTTSPFLAGTQTGIASARALRTRADELLLFDNGNVFSLSPDSAQWRRRTVDYRMPLMATSWQRVQHYFSVLSGRTDAASNGDITVMAWDEGDVAAPTIANIFITIIDDQSGAIIQERTNISGANGHHPRVRVVGGAFHVYFADGGTIRVLILTPGQSIGSVYVVPVVDLNTGSAMWDVDVFGTTAYLAYSVAGAPGAITFLALDSNGSTIIAPTTIALAGGEQVDGVDVCVTDTGDMVGISWTQRGTAKRVQATIRTAATLASVVGITTLDNTSAPIPGGLTAVFDAGLVGGVRVLHVIYEINAGVAVNTQLRHVTLSTTPTVGTHARFCLHSYLGTKAFLDGTDKYVGIQFSGVGSTGAQRQGFLAQIGTAGKFSGSNLSSFSDGGVVSKYLDGTSAAGRANPFNTTVPDAVFLPKPQLIGSRKWRIGADGTTGVPAALTTISSLKGLTGFLVVFDLDSKNAGSSAEVGNALYVNGGFLWQFDGVSNVEAGFLINPYEVGLTYGAGGALAAGAHSYRIYWYWLNATGELERSVPLSVTATSGAAQKATLVISTLSHTLKQGTRQRPWIVVFRAATDAAGPFLRVSNADPSFAGPDNLFTFNDETVDTVTFTDVLSDAAISTNETDYVSLGELANSSPPPALALGVRDTRLVLAGFENRGLVYPSKQRGFLFGVGFNEITQFQVGDTGGAVTALAEMNDAIVVFKERAIYICAGDGPNNSGAGTFAIPLVVTGDVGCVTPRGIARIPQGIIFVSTKGIWLLDQNFQLAYIGRAVEELVSTADIWDTTVLPQRNEVRFLNAAGNSLMFDYEFMEWSEFTHVGGHGAVNWQDNYVYATEDGLVFEETPGSFADDGASIPIILETGWIHLAGMQGYQRIRRFVLLGEWPTSGDVGA